MKCLIMNDSKKDLWFYSLLLLAFAILVIPFLTTHSVGAENNLSPSDEDGITRQYFSTYDKDAIQRQKEYFDFYKHQKELVDLESENKRLHELIEKQETDRKIKELEEENKRIKALLEKQEAELIKANEPSAPISVVTPVTLCSPQPAPVKKETTVGNLGQAGQQVVKETARVVNKTDREIKRIIKKF